MWSVNPHETATLHPVHQCTHCRELFLDRVIISLKFEYEGRNVLYTVFRKKGEKI
jgi:hypothetical protein